MRAFYCNRGWTGGTRLARPRGLHDSAFAAEEKSGKREAPPIDVSTGKTLNEAIEALNAQKYDDAKAHPREDEHGEAEPVRTRAASIRSRLRSPVRRTTTTAFARTCKLAIASGGLNDEEIQEARYQIAQMFIAQEKWQEGINALNEWFATAVNPNSTAYYLLAVAYYQLKKPDQALAPAQKAVDLSGDATRKLDPAAARAAHREGAVRRKQSRC